jgi:hypothetical protein
LTWKEKSLTTKDTKDHEGIHLQGFPSCTFVSFVVMVAESSSPELQTDRSFEPTTIALLPRVHFPIIESEHWGSHAKEA